MAFKPNSLKYSLKMYILQNIVFKKQKVKKNINNEMISEKLGENNHLSICSELPQDGWLMSAKQ